MKVLVTGVNGQLGFDVVRRGIEKGLDITGIGRADLNITDEQAVRDYVDMIKPSAIIHCAAYTAVDRAEDDKGNCWDVNVEGTKYLAAAAKNVGVKFLYVSTDYVFDGTGESPFLETDLPNPVGIYGATKYEAERQVQDLVEEHFIVRISWVFGINGNNFIKTMLKLAESRKELNVVGDQIGSPTYTYDVADLMLEMVQGEEYGIYHASNEGFCSWAEFSIEIFKQAELDMKVHSISTEEYPTRAVRPKNSRMSKEKLTAKGFDLLPPWQDAVKRYLNELIEEVK
ncbi:dTDP-4-dehydrorhamnose reductase [Planococcus sp. APC 3906]|uniref:dTDP-4-dehydrorhamnose reductase n=1 Tax=Planococcus sp. APC 3906 TaxID=3035194 RepID=UPI0025B3AC72|nr:dTDP-4-dehydrorhamnose reductase [Planococcus sp. APC 3906]MDN3451829.1 dTDP-4-dehydrorhamnose reductase [Planococcus sp. APC 3906]